MIKSIWASDSRFKPIQFGPGFNVVFADRLETASDKDSRNGLGKSTLVEIIHFCLGANWNSLKTLRAAELDDWTFYMTIVVQGHEVTVSRNTKLYPRVTISGDWSELPVPKVKFEQEKTELLMAVTEWTLLLGHWMYGLMAEEEQPIKYKPSFRGLISYAARRGPASYIDPFVHFAQQHEFDKQICNCFLLGLPWEYAAQFQLIKDRDKVLKQMKKAAEDGLLPGMAHEGIGELEATKVDLDRTIRKMKEQLANFRINEQYRDIQKKANSLTDETHDLINENIDEHRLQQFYEKSLRDESEPSSVDLLSIYEEAGVLFPNLIKRRFDDVELFHKQLIKNRRQFLQNEILRLGQSVKEREQLIDSKTKERSALLLILKTEGAIEEHIRLQQLLADQIAKLNSVEKQISDIAEFQKGRSTLRVESELLYQKAQTDYIERRAQRDKAVSLFDEASEFLYDEPGKLIIEVVKTGYRFNVDIERAASQGIGYMKVFCYDLTLAQIWADHALKPGFWVHDSTIFDGVDERQVASAIEFAFQKTSQEQFQYICMLNTDVIPWDLLKGKVDIEAHVRLRLTDGSEDGGLLGFRLSTSSESIAETTPEMAWV